MSPRRVIPRQKKNDGLPSWLVIGGIMVTIVLLVVVAVDFWSKIQPSPVVPSPSDLTASSRTAGDPNAPVSFTEFSDFQ